MKTHNPSVRDEHFPTDDEDDDDTYPPIRQDLAEDIKAAKQRMIKKAHKQFKRESR